MRNNIRIYEIKTEYIKYLSQYQKHLFMHDNGKEKRKYIGIILEINSVKYFAPLSSFKEKHKKMAEGVDFIKLKDYAVININNMIPVPMSQVIEIDINFNFCSFFSSIILFKLSFVFLFLLLYMNKFYIHFFHQILLLLAEETEEGGI